MLIEGVNESSSDEDYDLNNNQGNLFHFIFWFAINSFIFIDFLSIFSNSLFIKVIVLNEIYVTVY
jgi:hypothetical protein